MKQLRKCATVPVLLALMCDPLWGQSVGERLRITTERGDIMGTVRVSNADGFSLKLQGGASRSITYGEILKLERSLGNRTHAKKGFLIGFGAGVLAGIALDLAAAETCDTLRVSGEVFGVSIKYDRQCESFGASDVLFAVVLWGGGAGLAGLGVGSRTSTEEWETIPLGTIGRRFRIGPMFDVASLGGNRRALLGVRIRF